MDYEVINRLDAIIDLLTILVQRSNSQDDKSEYICKQLGELLDKL